uniref:Uncharacterized protein n=1 Tax=Amphimedon queenslandica TaxID=400682 RepID=A0A1X7SV92_AMPQE
MESNGEDKNNPLENGALIREKIRVLEAELKRLESQSLEEGELEGEGEKNEATRSGTDTEPDWVREG